MNKLLASLAAVLLAVAANTATAQTATVTTSAGTLHEWTPGSVFVVNEATGPVAYRYGEQVTYVTKSGQVINDADLRTRLSVGVPVTVHYSTVDDARVVNRVVVDDIEADDDDDDD